ncbi:MAG: hypothetical protein F6K22_33795, partial [Okeania sp. SIO2F4]|uniref:SBBP repeat-containing protein n=1 Tax=Okeania sp. SIO2F4 TaxID=2607790 RepID=UPI00142ACB28
VKLSQNASPTDITLTSNTVDENVAANTVVGTLTTTDSNNGDTFTYQLVSGTGDTDNAAFTIDGDRLKIKSFPDYETKSSYNIRVKTTDAAGASYEEQLTININDVNENSAPTALSISNNSIDENVAANTVVGTLSSIDPDAGDTFTYELVAGVGDTDNAAFTLDGDRLKINNSPDYETKSSYNIRVQTTDAAGETYQEELTININDVNENSTPSDLNFEFQVAQSIGGSGYDYGYGVATDSNGNVWATGNFDGSIDINGDGNNDLTSNGNSDGYVAKFDSNGNLLFAQNIGGSSSDWGHGIATDSNGNVWATGSFSDSIDIDSDGDNDLTNNGSLDSYLAKFDSNGNLLFAQNIGGSSSDWGHGIATDSNGNVWATGSFSDSIDIDSDGDNDLTSNGNSDSYLAKFDSNGNLLFAQNIGGSSTDRGWDIATDSNGNVWATGNFEGSIDIDSDGDNDLTSNGNSDSYVAKFNSNGNLLFAQNIGGSSTDQGRGIATDSNGNVWATGYFQESIDIDSDGNNDLTNNGSLDSYVAKFDSNGNLLFAQNIGGSGGDYGYGIATDSNSNVWVTGQFLGSIDIDSDGDNDLTSNGSADIYVAKFDNNGNLLFARNIGGSSGEVGQGIATDSNGNVWATGYFWRSIDIDGDGNNDLTNNGSFDSYVAKFSPVSPQDTTPPTAINFTPADNTTDIAIGADLVIEFDENVQKGTGNIVIKQLSDNSTVETIDVTSGQVTISNNTLTINPTADLAEGTEYYVEIDSGAIEDTAGNDYAGMSDVTTWNFTTVSNNNNSEPVEFDFNGDSKADILWRNDTTGDNQIWATNPTNIQGLPNRSSDWSIPQIGNFDNDTSMEILWRNSTSGENQIWNVDGTTEVSGLPTRSSQWQPLQAGDFDGDNIDELLWRNTNNGVNQIWDVDGTTQVRGLLTRNNNWTAVAVGDFDGDNIDELLWRNNSTGQNQIWNVDGTTQVRGLPNRSSNWEVAQVGDFDGDNIDELLWRNNSTGQNQIWNVDGTTQTKGLPNRSSNWEVAQVGDFDGDNIDELLWRNNSSGQNQLWNVDGTTQVRGLPNRSSNWEVAQVGDFDSDNIDELLWRNNNNGQNQLWNVDGSVGISGISSQVADWQVI